MLDQQVGQSKTDSEGIAGTADKLEKALEEFQTQQIGLSQRDGDSVSGDVSGESDLPWFRHDFNTMTSSRAGEGARAT